jgi:murein DD-endopeptidase MepM/ murein hydrolase activator NlpD
VAQSSARCGWSLAVVLILAGCGGGDGDSDGQVPQDCAGFSPPADSPYRLPWHVGQTWQANPHLARETSVQRFAIDVAMPIGTDVLALRAGTVVRVEESYFDGDNLFGHENHVFVQHEDGTVARYFHLTNSGALVQAGDKVTQGQRIGLSGHTGASSQPHLHFDVTRSCCTLPPNYNELPAGETLPLTFRNASPDSSCGLLFGARYTAQP